MTDLATFRFFVTPEHACSYLDRQDAATLFVDPKLPLDEHTYSQLSDKGFRRSGSYLYRPHCQHCDACIPLRIPVADFELNKRQRRVARKNEDLKVTITPARFTESHYDLYARYISLRHADGDMFPPSRDQYTSFLLSEWSQTQFMEFTHHDQLVAVAVLDQLKQGVSAVYTFFDPMAQQRSLGVYAVLQQIQHCQAVGLPYVYLGYWVQACRKMAYKNEFRPVEAFVNHQWERLAS
jgi:arginine-tRNA-protein transferase